MLIVLQYYSITVLSINSTSHVISYFDIFMFSKANHVLMATAYTVILRQGKIEARSVNVKDTRTHAHTHTFLFVASDH